MRFVKRCMPLVMFVFLAASAHADENGYLSTEEIERVRAVKMMLEDVDTKSLPEMIRELEKTRHPSMNLEMKEAMARTYTDIVREIGVDGQKKKEWLYSMVCLNMAYLQFGGGPGTPGSTTSLNRLIRQKLKKYLPPHALEQPGFVYALD